LISLRVILAQTGFSSTGTTAKVATDAQWDLEFQCQISVLCRIRAILPVLWRTLFKAAVEIFFANLNDYQGVIASLITGTFHFIGKLNPQTP
jgi:hypothetical protein